MKAENMFLTPAFAQTGVASAEGGILVSIIPFILIIGVMYFLMIRPQQKRMKQHREMIANVRRGDNVVSSGGLIGRITRIIDDREIEIEIAENTRVRLMRSMIAEVRVKGEPATDASSEKEKGSSKS